MEIWELMEFSNIETFIPHVPCVYFLMNGQELIYIGQTKNLNTRISRHRFDKNDVFFVGGEPLDDLMFDSVYWYDTGNSTDLRLLVESLMIDEYYPKYNSLIPEMKNYVEGWRPDPTRFDTYTQR